ncbi:NIPSNAP family protein [Flavobacterium sp. AED]|uniref:NIPSNAP family protein n=1 Tax=Flavobacterium sp. AED TaxID=1423323 RepID=UPI00057E6990|nr:NIPSNAP family protein [Flavobacterium sp. AED]KIA83988.1 NIPSNAP family containing protein [Flavobacterium sp. AED]MDI1305708.1 NIPSNAP family protein [bacterium]
MKATKLLFLVVIALAITSFKTITSDSKIVAPSREFYQLKTYILNTEQQVQTTDKFLKEAYLPGLKKMGIKNIGVFKPKPNATDTLKKIIVLIPFSSLSQFLGLEEKLAKDKTYLAAGADYLNASYKQAPYVRIESVLLKAFADHPMMTIPAFNSPRANRVYELRSYESATEAIYRNKVDMFNAGGEVKLFDRLVFNPVFYGEVISGAKMPNLMYMTSFTDQESRDAHWKAFVDSPEWKGLIAMEKYKNNISHIDITFLYPTDYSDY